MGGHYGGQEASRRAITTIFEQIALAPAELPAAALKFAVEIAARRVYELGGPADNKIRPGSTVVAMLFHDHGVDVAHVGDSRAYVIRSGQIYPLTRDHSMVQAMIDAGFITEEQAIGHPDANKITRALGMKPEVEVEVRPEPMELFPGDLLLTASDGLTDLALPKDILGATRQALASGGLAHGCEQLVRMANDRGGHDNITVQLVRVVATPAQKTKAGVTQPGALASTVSVVAHAPTQQQFQVPVAAPAAAPSQPYAAAQPQTPMPPPADTSVARSPSTTIPMQPAATAHDGTSRNSHAAQAPTVGAPGYGPRGTVPHADPRQNFASYRSDNAGGLPRPPQSTRVDPGRSTPADPSAWGRAPASASGAGVDSSAGRSGGGVLFMALAISFVVACVAIAVAWLLFFR
jgi:protein phosphatase